MIIFNHRLFSVACLTIVCHKKLENEYQSSRENDSGTSKTVKKIWKFTDNRFILLERDKKQVEDERLLQWFSIFKRFAPTTAIGYLPLLNLTHSSNIV